MDPTSSSAVDPDHPETARRLLRRALLRNRRALAGSISLVTLWQVCESMVPVLIGVVIDRAVTSGDWVELMAWSVVLAVHFAVLSTAYRLGSRIGFGALQAESHRLRTEVSAHVLHPRGARTDRLPGDVLAAATSDAELASAVVRQVTYTTAAVLGLVVSAVVLAVIDPVLAVVVLVGVPIVLVCTQALAPRLARRSEVRQSSIGRASGVATDLVSGIRPLKGIGAEATALARYRVQSQDAARASISAAGSEGVLYGVTQALSGAFLAVVALLAGMRALDGSIGIGELVAVVGLAQFVAEPMMLLAYLIAQVAESRASAGRIVDLLAAPRLVTEGSLEAGCGGLEVVDVSYGPLSELSFAADDGRLVAVVAEDPVDAAALMTLLRGEACPDSGEVRLGGVRLTDLRVEQVRARLLVTDHHVDLFEGTLRSNVDPSGALTGVRLTETLAAAAADDVVRNARLGPDEPVSVGGSTLSGGQRQRLGLARALAVDAEVLVLHDPTTAVDSVTEHRIAQALRDLRHGDPAVRRSTVVLTNSPALLSRADEVVHLRSGTVLARGTHHDLSAREDYRNAVLR